MIDVHRDAGLLVGHAEAGRVDKMAVAGDGDRETRDIDALRGLQELALQGVEIGAVNGLSQIVSNRAEPPDVKACT